MKRRTAVLLVGALGALAYIVDTGQARPGTQELERSGMTGDNSTETKTWTCCSFARTEP